MGEDKILYVSSESCPFDLLLVRRMKETINTLLRLNLKRFRVPEKSVTKYSALDVMKQALELLFEFAPSERNYREALRTIRVYSEEDDEMLTILTRSFRFIANAVYNAYTGQRHAEELSPTTLFLQGVRFDLTELQHSFRYVGVRPPDVSPSSVRKTVFVDEGFEAYTLLLESKISPNDAARGREEHWASKIEEALRDQSGVALMRVGREHIEPTDSVLWRLAGMFSSEHSGRLRELLRKRGVSVKLVDRIPDVNQVFGK